MQQITNAIQVVPIQHYLILCLILFTIGIIGALTRRNAIIVIMCVELMLNSVNLLLAAFSAYHADPAGQVFVFFIMVVAAAEVAVGLAILVLMKRNNHAIDINLLNRLSDEK
jgi:NADH-quinone oxidoreductase subunit K